MSADELRARLHAWIDDQLRALPDHRTPVGHGKAELLRELLNELSRLHRVGDGA